MKHQKRAVLPPYTTRRGGRNIKTDCGKSYIAINRAAYDALSEQYRQRSLNPGPFQEAASTLAGTALRACATPSEPKIALEIGPGGGEVLEWFARSGLITVAVEFASRIIEIARQRSPSTVFIEDDIRKVRFIPNQFDVIYAGALIHLFPKSDAVNLLSTIHSWLKPHGAFFVNTTKKNRSAEGFELKHDYDGAVLRFRKRWTEPELTSSVCDAGFHIVNRLYTDEKDRNKFWVALVCTKLT
jgi:2-polyprenyl-3-methyl-5-hydroxy-6-metoxy-1,4-benzoquinol methylase